jgi:hypothetical protein
VGSVAGSIPVDLLYSLFGFMRRELQNAWFGVKIEPDDTDPTKKYTKVKS